MELALEHLIIKFSKTQGHTHTACKIQTRVQGLGPMNDKLSKDAECEIRKNQNPGEGGIGCRQYFPTHASMYRATRQDVAQEMEGK